MCVVLWSPGCGRCAASFTATAPRFVSVAVAVSVRCAQVRLCHKELQIDAGAGTAGLKVTKITGGIVSSPAQCPSPATHSAPPCRSMPLLLARASLSGFPVRARRSFSVSRGLSLSLARALSVVLCLSFSFSVSHALSFSVFLLPGLTPSIAFSFPR